MIEALSFSQTAPCYDCRGVAGIFEPFLSSFSFMRPAADFRTLRLSDHIKCRYTAASSSIRRTVELLQTPCVLHIIVRLSLSSGIPRGGIFMGNSFPPLIRGRIAVRPPFQIFLPYNPCNVLVRSIAARPRSCGSHKGQMTLWYSPRRIFAYLALFVFMRTYSRC